MKITHILVTSDLSPEALRPCEPIAALARALGARITLLNVVEDLPVAPLGTPFEPVILAPDLSARVESARAHLEKHRDLFDGANVNVEVVTGVEAVYTIMDYANKNDVDLIAMSTHGRTGFRRLVLGSIAEALLRRSTVPVLVFPRPNVEASVARKTA